MSRRIPKKVQSRKIDRLPNFYPEQNTTKSRAYLLTKKIFEAMRQLGVPEILKGILTMTISRT